MKGPAKEPPQWSRRRFLGLVGILFALQAGLILLLAEREHTSPGLVPAPGRFRLLGTPLTADQLAKTFFAIDPSVFPLSSPHGFSERAWLRLPEQEFEAPSPTEARAWLPIDAARLGANFPPLSRAKSPLPSSLAERRDPELDVWPAFLAPEQIRTQSVFEIQGELAGRQLNRPADLRAWPCTQLLSNSVVQIAADSAGQVIAARLLERSGSTDADSNALDEARNLRFRPAPAPALVWGNIVFEWQTLEPTNAGAAGSP